MTRILLTSFLMSLSPIHAVADELADTAFDRGMAAFFERNYDKAIDEFNEVIRRDPKRTAAYYFRGMAYGQKQNYILAQFNFSEVIELDPKNANAFNYRGICSYGMRKFDDAIQDYDEAIRLDPRNADAFHNRGLAHVGKKEFDRANKDFDDAIELAPEKSSVNGGFAWVLATCPNDKFRDGKKALKLATKACEVAEWQVSSVLEILAAAHAECGNFKEAAKCQKKAIELGINVQAAYELAMKKLKLFEDGKPYRDE